jgi:hypothetical protein
VELPWDELAIDLTDALTLDAMQQAREKGVSVDSLKIETTVKRYVDKTISAFAKSIHADGLTPESALMLARELLDGRRNSQPQVTKRATPSWLKHNGHYVY